MLEGQGLVLRPWAPAAEGATRAILDAATGAPLGFARWRRTASGWPRRPLLEVFETEDAALLCTAHARWGLARWWDDLLFPVWLRSARQHHIKQRFKGLAIFPDRLLVSTGILYPRRAFRGRAKCKERQPGIEVKTALQILDRRERLWF